MEDEIKKGQEQAENKTETGDSTGASKPEGEKPNAGEVTFSAEQQEFLNKLIRKAKDEGRDTAKAQLEEEQRKASEEAERKQLAEKQQFKELSEKQQADLTALEAKAKADAETLKAVTEERDRYKVIVETSLSERRKGLPEHITALLDELDPIKQLEWLAANADKTAQRPGIGTPRDIGKQNGKPPGQTEPEQPGTFMGVRLPRF